MTDIKITTNNQYREFISGCDLTAKEREEFDYYDNQEDLDTATFVRYKGLVYDLKEFMRSDAFEDWDGVAGQSYFSGVLLKISEDGDAYKIGTYTN